MIISTESEAHPQINAGQQFAAAERAERERERALPVGKLAQYCSLIDKCFHKTQSARLRACEQWRQMRLFLIELASSLSLEI